MIMLYLAVFVLLITAACDNDQYAMDKDSDTLQLSMHTPINEITTKSPIVFKTECMQELELCWYKIDRSANSTELPSIIISNFADTLILPQVTSITMLIDGETGTDVENLNITLRGLPDNSPHYQTVEFISSLIESIKSANWTHYYFPSDPRIPGSQAQMIESPDQVMGEHVTSHPWLDPDYPIDMTRWMKIQPFANWYFYNKGIHLHLRTWRRDSKDNPSETGTYLITLELKTEKEYWMSGFSGRRDRARWKELLTENLKTYRYARLLKEEKARAAGIEIDEKYEDPPIKALE